MHLEKQISLILFCVRAKATIKSAHTHRITLSVCRFEPTGTHHYQHRHPRKLRKAVQSQGFDFICAVYRWVLRVHVYNITALIGFKCRSEVEGEVASAEAEEAVGAEGVAEDSSAMKVPQPK
jgi:hypothetical protein